MSRNPGARAHYQTPNQRELAGWISKTDYNIFATLTFKPEFGVKLRGAERAFAKFASSLAAHFEKSGMSMPAIVPVIEGSYEQWFRLGTTFLGREGTHIHVLMQLPGEIDANRELIRKLWVQAGKRICGDPRVYCPSSNDWFKEITTAEERDAYIGYVTKYMQDDCIGLLLGHMNLRPSGPLATGAEKRLPLDFPMFKNVISYE